MSKPGSLKELLSRQHASLQPLWNLASTIGDYAAAAQTFDRTLYLFNEIKEVDNDETNTAYLIKALRLFDAISDEPIIMYVNSIGGDILAGMALVQTMRDLDAPVHTFVIGQAASMAAVVAIAGIKRLAYPGARWLLHRGKEEAEGDHEDLMIEAKEFKAVDKMADKVITSLSKFTPKQLDTMSRKNLWLGTPEALKWGIVDEIVVPRRGPQTWLPEEIKRPRKPKVVEAKEKEPVQGSEGVGV